MQKNGWLFYFSRDENAEWIAQHAKANRGRQDFSLRGIKQILGNKLQRVFVALHIIEREKLVKTPELKLKKILKEFASLVHLYGRRM